MQVALDMMHLKRALAIGREAVEGGADWIEVGTPLLKSEGAEAVRALRKAFPERTIVADMKTMDVGGFEVEIAVKAGADVVTVMGLSDDATISESALTARRYGAKVMVDLMNVPDKVARAKRSAELGASYVCLHVGIDVLFELQSLRRPFFDLRREIGRDDQHADVFFGFRRFDRELDARSLELFDEIGAPPSLVLVEHGQRGLGVGLAPLEQVAENEDEDHGEDHHPEEKRLVLDRQLQVQKSDMPYFLHDRSLPGVRC